MKNQINFNLSLLKIFILFLFLIGINTLNAQIKSKPTKKINKSNKFKPKEKIINIINCTLAPQYGKEFPEDISYSQNLLDKYEVKFEAIKINPSSETCVFSFSEVGSTESNPADLSINQTINYNSINDKTLQFRATYTKFIHNKKNENSSEVSVKIEVIKSNL
jgi:hypothetical protein